jgi:hypothetical protein
MRRKWDSYLFIYASDEHFYDEINLKHLLQHIYKTYQPKVIIHNFQITNFIKI